MIELIQWLVEAFSPKERNSINLAISDDIDEVIDRIDEEKEYCSNRLRIAWDHSKYRDVTRIINSSPNLGVNISFDGTRGYPNHGFISFWHNNKDILLAEAEIKGEFGLILHEPGFWDNKYSPNDILSMIAHKIKK